MIAKPDHVTTCDNAMSALSLLTQPFFDQPLCLEGIESIDASELPPVAHGLLAHENHMTTTLQRHHGEPVSLHVLQHQQHNQYYYREIVLTLPSTNTIVEYGIVRISLKELSNEVRDAILAKQRPLGNILIDRDVLRHIKPQWFIKLLPRAIFFNNFPTAKAQETFGRIGVIYCHHLPAIELFEVALHITHAHGQDKSS